MRRTDEEIKFEAYGHTYFPSYVNPGISNDPVFLYRSLGPDQADRLFAVADNDTLASIAEHLRSWFAEVA